MTTTKLRASFAIDDILYQRPTGSNSLFVKHNSDITASTKLDVDAVGSTTSHETVKLPKTPVPLFPAMFDFNPAKYYLPHLSMAHQRFPPNTAYLEQYTNALQKGEEKISVIYLTAQTVAEKSRIVSNIENIAANKIIDDNIVQ